MIYYALYQNIVSYPHAMILKHRGYHQPPPGAGQFWYNDPGWLYVVVKATQDEVFYAHINAQTPSIISLPINKKMDCYAPDYETLLEKPTLKADELARNWLSK